MKVLTIKEVKKVVEEAISELGIMIKQGFDNTATKADIIRIESEIAAIPEMKSDIAGMKSNIERIETKLDRALHVEYVNLETRVKRIENKLRLKPT